MWSFNLEALHSECCLWKPTGLWGWTSVCVWSPALQRAGSRPQWEGGEGCWHQPGLCIGLVVWNKCFALWGHFKVPSSAAELECILFCGKIVGTWAIQKYERAGAVSLSILGLDFIFLLHLKFLIVTVQISDYLAIRVESNSASLLKILEEWLVLAVGWQYLPRTETHCNSFPPTVKQVHIWMFHSLL